MDSSMSRNLNGACDPFVVMQGQRTFTCVRRLHRVNKRMSALSLTIASVQAEADLVHGEVSLAHQRFGAILKDLIKLVETVSPMIPPDSAVRKRPPGGLGNVFGAKAPKNQNADL